MQQTTRSSVAKGQVVVINSPFKCDKRPCQMQQTPSSNVTKGHVRCNKQPRQT